MYSFLRPMLVFAALALPGIASAQTTIAWPDPIYDQDGYIKTLGIYQHCADQGGTCGRSNEPPYLWAPYGNMNNRAFLVAYGFGPELTEQFYQFTFVFGVPGSPISNGVFTCDGAALGFQPFEGAHCITRTLDVDHVTSAYNVMPCGQWGTDCAANGLAIVEITDRTGTRTRHLLYSGKIRCAGPQGGQADCRMGQLALGHTYFIRGVGERALTSGPFYPNGPSMQVQNFNVSNF